MKSLLVLGADTFQLGLIRFLKTKDFKIHVVSNRPFDAGNFLADYSHNIDYSNSKEVISLFKRVQANQIFCAASDAALFFQVQQQENLGIAFHSSNFVNFFLEKTIYKFQLLALLKNHSPFIFKIDEVNDLISNRKWPEKGIVAKTQKGSGSKNIVYLKQEEQFLKFRAEIFNDSYFFENYIEGQEIGGDFICLNGQLLFFKPTIKFVNSFYVPIAHLVLKENKNENPAIDFLKKFIQLFEIEDGIYNVDLIVNNKRVYLIDISPRIGGNCIPEIVCKSFGVNEYEVVFNFLLNKNLSTLYPKWNCQHGVYIFGAEKKGKINRLSKGELPFQKHIVELYWKFKVGDEVDVFSEGSKHLGYVIFKANSDEELLSIYNEIKAFEWFLVS